MNPLFADMPTTIFEAMSALARETGAINLGQGFPDDPGPGAVRRVAAEAVLGGSNQYPPMMGTPDLRRAVAAHYAHWQGLALDPEREVLVTSGATEALAASILAIVRPGDEVILFEPAYDAYLPLVRLAGGVPRFVTLQPPDFRLPADALAAAITPKTRVVLFNDPLNPTATVASAQDRALLADLCVRHDLVAICDEVWEHVVFDGHRHRSLIAEPGMRERAVKIGSAGKIFNLTGWKVGMVIATPCLLGPVAKAHQFLTFTTAPNLQAAVAFGLALPDDAFATIRSGHQASRDHFTRGLRDIGFAVIPSAATYFVNIDIAPLGESDDVAFCRRLALEHGVVAIPVSAFYPGGSVTNVVRFCFAKRPATLDAALERLAGASPRVR